MARLCARVWKLSFQRIYFDNSESDRFWSNPLVRNTARIAPKLKSFNTASKRWKMNAQIDGKPQVLTKRKKNDILLRIRQEQRFSFREGILTLVDEFSRIHESLLLIIRFSFSIVDINHISDLLLSRSQLPQIKIYIKFPYFTSRSCNINVLVRDAQAAIPLGIKCIQWFSNDNRIFYLSMYSHVSIQ